MQRRTLLAAAVAALLPKPSPAAAPAISGPDAWFAFYSGCDDRGLPLPDLRRDFGAVGDGVTDDTAAWQRALASGQKFHVPRGTYRITTGLDDWSMQLSILDGGT